MKEFRLLTAAIVSAIMLQGCAVTDTVHTALLLPAQTFEFTVGNVLQPTGAVQSALLLPAQVFEFAVDNVLEPAASAVGITEQGQRASPANAGVSSGTSKQSAPISSTVGGFPCAEDGSCYSDISTLTGRPKTMLVLGYYRKDGTYVQGHYRDISRWW